MSNEIDAQLQELVDSLEDYLDYRGAWSDQKRAWVAEDIQAYAQERVEAREAAIVEEVDRLKNLAQSQSGEIEFAFLTPRNARETIFNAIIAIVKGVSQ